MFKNSKSMRLIFFAGLLCMCGKTGHPHLKTADPEFVNAYIDLLYLQERHARPVAALEDSIKIIFENHRITQDIFLSTIHQLNNNPDHWEAFLQEVLNQLNSIDTTRIAAIDRMKVLSDLEQRNFSNQAENRPQDEK